MIGLKKYLVLTVYMFILGLLISACANQQGKRYEDLLNMVKEAKSTYAPDGRVAVFDVKAQFSESSIVLTGQSDQIQGVKEFIAKLEEEGFSVRDSILRLPDPRLSGNIFGVVNNSVANIRSKPKHSAELATQALLGMDLKVLKQEGEWYLVQTSDDYISWVDHGGLVPMSEEEYLIWKGLPKVIYTGINGHVYKGPDATTPKISDLVLGCVLGLQETAEGFSRVIFPDGRTGYVATTEVAQYDTWLLALEPTGRQLKKVAEELVGSPYLWGGTSVKGMDCSGFTKTIYLMNGLVIPRDASQQVHAGMTVDADLSFKDMEEGDLLFFGRAKTDSTRQRVTHVGMWIGNNEFIHSSQRVRVSSVDPEAPNYDAFNKNRYLGSRRYLGHLKGNIETLKPTINHGK